MTGYREPPREVWAVLAFGLPLRDGLELVRARGRGGTFVVGWGDDCEARSVRGDEVDQELTAESVFRATEGDNATALDVSCRRIIRRHVMLIPQGRGGATGLGTRHHSAEMFAKETGRTVVVVSEERQTITLFSGEGRFELRRKAELQTEIDNLRSVLHLTIELLRRDIDVPPSRRSEAEAKLARLDGHLAELGPLGGDIRDECQMIATLLNSLPPARADGGGGTWNEVSGSATNVIQARSIQTVNVLPPAKDLPVPRQLPPHIALFADRVDEVAEVVRMLTAGDSPAKICLVTGGAGIGKSAFAVRCGHLLDDQFPDGILYADLRGFHPADPPADPAEVLSGFLRDLGLGASSIPADLDGMTRLYRSRLHGGHLLVVLDNARDSAQVRPLLAGAPTCATLVTSRTAMSDLVVLEGAARIRMPALPSEDARDLLALITQTTAGPPLTELAELCGRHPLALRIAGAQVAAGSLEAIQDLVCDFRRSGLDAFDLAEDDPASMRAVLSSSCQALPAEVKLAFGLLGSYPGATIAAGAAAALIGGSKSLRALADANLIEEIGRNRYRMHSLTRAYATEVARQTGERGDHRAAVQRAFDWSWQKAETYGRALDRWHPRSELADDAPEPIDKARANSWFDDELANIATVTQFARDEGADDAAWRLALAFSPYFFSRKPWSTWIVVQETGLAAARAAGDRDGEAWLCDSLAVAYREQQRHDEALRYLALASAGFSSTANVRGSAQTGIHLAQTYRELGNLHRAEQAAEASLRLFRQAGSRHGEARASNLLGGIELARGAVAEALAHTRLAKEVFEELNDEHAYSWALNNLGAVLAEAGDHAGAITAYYTAMVIREHVDQFGFAVTCQGLGDTHHAAGDPVAARRYWRKGWEVFDRLGDPRARVLRAKLDS
ncbi:tetratricopeptide repeat protein [Amycolatopsis sp. CA-128772]|uniref:tetratricopeptide repeat protein n=1 Tax=Amycolatopsis sp. CA-128772 TaxID=2073159 RepID=UPI000CD069B3|nr:tetratricopeptide repeat protein [Amycolatopsis sp. CA-128772]